MGWLGGGSLGSAVGWWFRRHGGLWLALRGRGGHGVGVAIRGIHQVTVIISVTYNIHRKITISLQISDKSTFTCSSSWIIVKHLSKMFMLMVRRIIHSLRGVDGHILTKFFRSLCKNMGKYCIQGYFLPSTLAYGLPPLKFAQTRLCTKEITWNIGIRLVLNSPTDNEGERDKNKTGANFSQ